MEKTIAILAITLFSFVEFDWSNWLFSCRKNL